MCAQIQQSDDPEIDKFGRYLHFSSQQLDIALEILLEIVAESPDEPILIFGYSRGGKTAMQLAKRLNEVDPNMRIDSLILVDPEPAYGWMPRRVPANVDQALHYFTYNSDERFEDVIPDGPIATFLFPAAPAVNDVVRAAKGIRADLADGGAFGELAGNYILGPDISDGVNYIWGARNVSNPSANHYTIYEPAGLTVQSFIKREGVYGDEP